MSIDATRWAWTAPVNTSSQRLVLLSLSDRAGEEHTAWPSMERLAADTVLNLKTVKKVVNELISLGLVIDTGKRMGPTGRVRVLALAGVHSREQTQNWYDLNKPKNGSIKDDNKPKNGTVKETLKRDDSMQQMNPILDSNQPKNGTLNEPKNGSQNLSMNLSMNLSQEHDWIPSLDQLVTKIKMTGHESDIEMILGLPSFEFELSAFNSYFDNSGLSENKKLHKFTAWIIDKFDRYKKQNPEYGIQAPIEQQTICTQPFINLPTKPKSLLGSP
ncbi:helix-turn-helix domain-containing protein [Acinetobacter wanghuae]|uniref:Helix-turn-helix domain-containing protein n=1 Tax=Acinetobacter wanghuae TaxID=2662362 RepID=A0A5Q0NZ13_9GAMM|nr:helix-turn-helix domain-containing protein [Acinetobacter wanghuae]MQW91962.1 helix-turn-helix domain-containing protein [Acinetobacter wanghuae]QGA10059.1 helix-turn-helix domain-containing protein [Acinetobacter wanghuae]